MTYKEIENIDLTEYLVNEDKPHGEEGRYGWGAGSQPEALKFYLDPSVVILNEYCTGDYQGDVVTLFYIPAHRRFVLWRDSYGSCSGCDGLEDNNGYEYIKSTLQEGSTRQFRNIEDAKEYWATTDDYMWNERPDLDAWFAEAKKKFEER